MTSTPSSQSEGEIFSSDDKATKSPPGNSGTSVDRQTRPLAAAPRSPAPRSNHSRSRSRSPYHASRGEKRRRDEGSSRDRSREHRRRLNVRYEDNRRGSHHHRGRGSYDKAELGGSSRKHDHYDEFDRLYSSKRARTRSRSRSRSPFRHSRDSDKHLDKPPSQDSRPRDGAGKGRSGTELSVSERSKASIIARPSRSYAETGTNQTFQGDSRASSRPSPDTRNARDGEDDEAPASVKPVLDEAAQIEERRKRREALKSKYRGQGTPLLVQALHLDAGQASSASGANTGQENPATPASQDPSSPQTPKDTSGVQSPSDFNFDKPEDISNAADGAAADDEREDEPSAADYDPTVDMQEERMRHDKRLFNEEPSPPATNLDQADKVSAQPVSKTPPKISKDTFDMFAEDEDGDELDMFAPAPATVLKPEPKAAQTLDVAMMDNWDDPEGYYNTILGELIQDRYIVQENLGRGMFASVIRATDTKTSQKVAIKIIRANETMYKAGKKEIAILQTLAAADLDDRKHIVRLLASFDHKGHLAMVFENLSMNLRDLLKQYGRNTGITLKAIRAYAQQLFLALSLLKKCGILHADLKPDNILVNDSLSTLKLADLGTACPVAEAGSLAPYLVSRFYRAPELILGIPYDAGIDVWSVGCTLFELYTGKILFTGRNNNGMLRSIMECRGKFPSKLLRRGVETPKYFDDLLGFRAIEEDRRTGKLVTRVIEVGGKPVKGRGLRERLLPAAAKRIDDTERREVELFLDLLERCLDLRAERRMTPTEALKHPFILRSK